MKYLIKKQSFLIERKFSKAYESIENEPQYEMDENEPQIGDYAICKETGTNASDRQINFVSDNIGNIVEYRPNLKFKYIVYYENAPEKLFTFGGKDKFRQMSREEIIYYSKNKEDCEVYMDTTKYNL